MRKVYVLLLLSFVGVSSTYAQQGDNRFPGSRTDKDPAGGYATIVLPKEILEEPARRFPALLYVNSSPDYHYQVFYGMDSVSASFDSIKCIRIFLDGDCLKSQFPYFGIGTISPQNSPQNSRQSSPQTGPQNSAQNNPQNRPQPNKPVKPYDFETGCYQPDYDEVGEARYLYRY